MWNVPSKTCWIRLSLSATLADLPEALTSPFREAETLGRLDWQITNNYKLFYRFSYDQNHSVLAIIPITPFNPSAT